MRAFNYFLGVVFWVLVRPTLSNAIPQGRTVGPELSALYFFLDFLLKCNSTTGGITAINNNSTKQHLTHRTKRQFNVVKLFNVGKEIALNIMDIHSFIKSENDISNSDLAKKIDSVETGLKEIKDDIKNVINAVREESVRNQYVAEEKVIDNSVRALAAYTEHLSTKGESVYLRESFLAKAAKLEDSISTLMKGMMGPSSLGGDIVLALRDGVDVTIFLYSLLVLPHGTAIPCIKIIAHGKAVFFIHGIAC